MGTVRYGLITVLLSAIGLTQSGPVAHAVPAVPEFPGSSATPVPPAAAPAAVYASEFASGKAGEQWSNGLIEKSPNGKRTFLGTFGTESTLLRLDNLPDHARIRLSFDVMIILTWDGDASLDKPVPTAPDTFNVTVDHGPRLLNASFVCRPSSDASTQSFPGTFPYDHVRYGTTAIESGSLGYFWNGGFGAGSDDYVYHVERTFAHAGKSLKIAFSGINLEEKANECWGLDNVRVEILPAVAPQPLDKRAFDKCWLALGEQNPQLAVTAIAALVELGDTAAGEIRQRLQAPASLPDRDALIRTLIHQLDNDSYPLREQASAALKDFGPAIEPTLRAALRPDLPPEARTRIEALLADFAAQANGTPAERRARRLAEVLELIGTPTAHQGLADLAESAAAFPAFEANAAIQRLDGQSPLPTKLELPPGLPPPPNVAPPPTPTAIIRLMK